MAQHHQWQEALDHGTEGQVALEGLLAQVLEGQKWCRLIQEAIPERAGPYNWTVCREG